MQPPILFVRGEHLIALYSQALYPCYILAFVVCFYVQLWGTQDFPGILQALSRHLFLRIAPACASAYCSNDLANRFHAFPDAKDLP
jgi:hypothetical protein